MIWNEKIGILFFFFSWWRDLHRWLYVGVLALPCTCGLHEEDKCHGVRTAGWVHMASSHTQGKAFGQTHTCYPVLEE